MKNLIIGVWSFYSEFSKNNYMLDYKSSVVDKDVFWGQNQLKKIGLTSSVIFKTLDLIDDWSILDEILVFDYPEPIIYKKCKVTPAIVKKILQFKVPSFLVLQECSVIKPNNWNLSNHKKWKKIFTWSDDFKDNKYVVIRQHPRKTPKNWWIRKIPKKLSTMISTNKKSFHEKEGQSERIRCIEWFNENQPLDLDLYGYGWDQYRFSNKYSLLEKINKITPLMKLFGPKYDVRKGVLNSKREIAFNYKFHFTYENAIGVNGYTTEKIIETFLLCSVPIYYGAFNISSHINSDCFIDFRNFDNYDDLYKFLSSMSNNEYLTYLDNIKAFLDGPEYYPFTTECYTKTIISNIKSEILMNKCSKSEQLSN